MRRLVLMVLVVLAAALLITARESEHLSNDFIQEENLDEQDARFVSLCVVTDQFSSEEYERVRAVMGKAASRFEPFDLHFYIPIHAALLVPNLMETSYVAQWRNIFEPTIHTQCDLMLIFTNDDYSIEGVVEEDTFAGIFISSAGQRWILIDSFSGSNFNELVRTMQHELGHAFGAVHVSSKSVMNKHATADSWDLQNFNIIMRNRDKFR